MRKMKTLRVVLLAFALCSGSLVDAFGPRAVAVGAAQVRGLVSVPWFVGSSLE